MLLTGLSSFLLEACKKSDVRREPNIVHFTTPEGFPQPVYDFTANPLTKEGIALGQKLFYEDSLSAADFSCASCHQQIGAFTTYEHDRSHGYNHSHTLRNAPALSNLAWQAVYRQDGSATDLENVSLAHITAPDEMAENIDNVVAKLKRDSRYRAAFKAAYGDENITSERILKALKQFLLSMVSSNSKYDKVKRGEASFGVYEEMGYSIFKAKCASCHAEPLFTDHSYRNIGLPVNPSLLDYGRMRETGNKADSLKFRVPSLRNVEFSSYYFHDGRYSNIQRAIEHYRNDVQQSSTLDPSLVNGISLTDTDVINLIAFLKTLSDSSYIRNSEFGKPTF
jgi:cytochrome c peroxidase